MADALASLRKIFGGLSMGAGGSCVGISIGTSSIKMVELKKKGNSFQLTNMGVAQLPEDAVVNREILNSVPVEEALRTLTTQMGLKNKKVCVSLTGPSIIVKRLEVEVSKPSELQDQVFWEAEQYLTFEATDVVMDFQLLSPIQNGRADVILVAAKKSTLENLMGAIQRAGLEPHWVDIDFFAMNNLFEATYPSRPGEAIMLVDIGAHAVKLVVSSQGIPLFTKDTALGGAMLTKEIQKHLNLNFADAEALKSAQSAVPQQVMEITHMHSEHLATEIKRGVEFFNASNQSVPLVGVLLMGGGARLRELPVLVEQKTGLPCQVIQAFNSLSYDTQKLSPEFIQQIGPQMGCALGLAMRASEK